MRFIYTKAFAIFAGCLVAALLLVFLQLKGWLDPVRSVVLNAPRPLVVLVKDITVPVKNFFTTIYQLNRIAKENADLRNQVIVLKQDLVQQDQQQKENDALRKELGFVNSNPFHLAPCTVLSPNAFGLTDSVLLNCGTDQGVAEGQAIISQGYVVGKIVYAGKSLSTALLATSSKFSTDARVSKTGDVGLIKGSFDSGLILDQVPQTSDLEPGWLIVTAGVNQQIPKNILIGQVSDILSGSSDLFKRAALSSPIDFNNLEFVFAVKQ